MTIDTIGTFNLNKELNGYYIPDMVEFYLLEMVLEDYNHPLHDDVSYAYQNNLAIWMDYNNAVAEVLPGFVYPPSGVVHALAAYSTIHPCTVSPGDISGIAATLYWLHLYRLYETMPPMSAFAAPFMAVPELFETADLDEDTFSNLEE